MNGVTTTLDTRRAKAREGFRSSGVPHRRVEDWKYSDLYNAVAANDVEFAEEGLWAIDHKSGSIEVFDLASHEKPDWVQRHLGTLSGSSPMAQASLGFARSGFAIRVPNGGRADIQVNWRRAGQARTLIVLEENATLRFVESADGTIGVRNIGMEFLVARGAQLTHTRFAFEEASSAQVCDISVRLLAESCYRAHYANFGGKISRTEVHAMLEGEGAEARLSGVSILENVHADVTTHVTHASGKTRSAQLFKYVAAGTGRGVYQGKVTVAEGANGSDSRQTAKGLLLGNRAEIDLKPELEILADDVKCAHGAAVGDLDAESLFYLRSRGIPENEARELLMRAFLGDAIEQVEDEKLRDLLWEAVDQSLVNVS